MGREGRTVEKVRGGLIRLQAMGTGRRDGVIDLILVAPKPAAVGGPELGEGGSGWARERGFGRINFRRTDAKDGIGFGEEDSLFD